MVAQSADGDIPDRVDFPQKLRIHTKHSARVGKKKHLSLGGAGIVCPIHRSHGSHTQGSLFLVDLSRIFFPDENGFLADIQQLRDVFFRNDVAALKGGAFKTVTHGGNIVAKFHADGRFNRYFLHFLSSQVSFGVLRNQNHILRNRIRSYYNRIAL